MNVVARPRRRYRSSTLKKKHNLQSNVSERVCAFVDEVGVRMTATINAGVWMYCNPSSVNAWLDSKVKIVRISDVTEIDVTSKSV